jgi:hypothetical protein
VWRLEKIFNHHTIGDKMLLIITSLAIKSILSPIVWQLKIFNHYTIDGKKLSITITWVIEIFQSPSMW